MILTAFAGIVGAAGAFLSATVTDTADDFLAGRISADEFNDAYRTVQLVSTLTSPFSLACAVVSVVWLYRIAANVRTYARHTTWHPLFTIFGWLLPPVLNLVPLLVLRELWKASTPEAEPGADSWRQSPENPLLYVWFVLYGVVPFAIFLLTISSVLDGFLNASGSDEIAAETVSASGPYNIVSGITTLAAAIVWILIVKQLTARHIALTGER
jgi:uncharacterized BrkB/YihY/UPF0761 family membrane protein